MGNGTDKSTVSSKDESGAKEAPTTDKFGVHLAQIAWRVAIPFLLFSLSGIMLDRVLDSKPIFSVIGVFVALAAVSLVVYKYVQQYFPDTFGGTKK